LRWLGLECPRHRCSEPIDALNASVWFVRRGHPWLTFPPETLIVVDLTSAGHPLAYGQRMFDTVNDCTGGDGIRLCRRFSADTTDTEAVALMVSHPGSSGGVGLLV
jgi:hypothetical protein